MFLGKVWCEARDVCSFKMAVEMARFGATGGAKQGKDALSVCAQSFARMRNK